MDVTNRRLHAGTEIHDETRATGQGPGHGVDGVVHEEEVTGLAAIAVEAGRGSRAGRFEEVGDHSLARLLTRPVQVGEGEAGELQAVLVAPWTSTGIAEDGSRFDRPGRATIVVRRTATDAAWFGVHTHFSLARGVPQQSFGSTAR